MKALVKIETRTYRSTRFGNDDWVEVTFLDNEGNRSTTDTKGVKLFNNVENKRYCHNENGKRFGLRPMCNSFTLDFSVLDAEGIANVFRSAGYSVQVN